MRGYSDDAWNPARSTHHHRYGCRSTAKQAWHRAVGRRKRKRCLDAFPWVGFAGPAQLPDDIVDKVAADTIKVLAMQDVQERIAAIGLVTATLPSAEFANYVAS